MARLRKKVVLTGLAAATPGIAMAGFTAPAHAATDHVAAHGIGAEPVNRPIGPAPRVNNFWAYYKSAAGLYYSYAYSCRPSRTHPNYYGSMYLSQVKNNCEYRVWISNLNSTNHCVDPGYKGYVPGGFHYPFSFDIGKLTGDC
jgi:hypothetical protein